MKKIALIPSREEMPNPDLSAYLISAGWTPMFLTGYSNIFEAFSEGLKLADVGPKDYVIMCHDDIDILSKESFFNQNLDSLLGKSDTGFIGVAGTRLLTENAVWWESMGYGSQSAVMGFVSHGTLEKNHTTFYGPNGQAVVLDGLFLCAKGSTLNQIMISKPKMFTGGWDFYDLFYTTQTHLKGLKNYVVPIHILHKSLGDTNGKDSWYLNREAYKEAFKKHLPLFVN